MTNEGSPQEQSRRTVREYINRLRSKGNRVQTLPEGNIAEEMIYNHNRDDMIHMAEEVREDIGAIEEQIDDSQQQQLSDEVYAAWVATQEVEDQQHREELEARRNAAERRASEEREARQRHFLSAYGSTNTDNNWMYSSTDSSTTNNAPTIDWNQYDDSDRRIGRMTPQVISPRQRGDGGWSISGTERDYSIFLPDDTEKDPEYERDRFIRGENMIREEGKFTANHRNYEQPKGQFSNHRKGIHLRGQFNTSKEAAQRNYEQS